MARPTWLLIATVMKVYVGSVGIYLWTFNILAAHGGAGFMLALKSMHSLVATEPKTTTALQLSLSLSAWAWHTKNYIHCM